MTRLKFSAGNLEYDIDVKDYILSGVKINYQMYGNLYRTTANKIVIVCCRADRPVDISQCGREHLSVAIICPEHIQKLNSQPNTWLSKSENRIKKYINSHLKKLYYDLNVDSIPPHLTNAIYESVGLNSPRFAKVD